MKLDRLIAVRNTKTVYRDGNRCIKVFYHCHSKADIISEALNQARMEETEIKVPKIMEVTTIDGKWAIVSEFIRGKTMSQLMREHPEDKDTYLALLVQLQLSVLSNTSYALNDLKSRLRLGIHAASLDASVKERLLSRLERMPEQNFICHGDFYPSNIIISEENTPYIIDWSHAVRGSAYADAAQTYLSFRLFDGPETAERYIHLFCEKAGIDISAVLDWIPILAASRASGEKQKESEILLSLALTP